MSVATDATSDFDHIESAEAPVDGVFELPLLPLGGAVLFPQVLSLIPLTDEAQVRAADRAREQATTMMRSNCDTSGMAMR